MNSFKAWRIPYQGGEAEGGVNTLQAGDLPEGDVLIKAAYSGLNYKDALAVTGKGKIARQFPLTPGIDVAGEVVSDRCGQFSPGDKVLVTGCGMGEVHDGGFAEYVQVPADWVVPLPSAYTPRQAMALGTAGFTVALALIRMEAAGQRPERGDVVVTGASGGVGSLAVDLFSSAGYNVLAVSGKPDAGDYLRKLGASEVVTPDALELGSRPLDKARFAGVVDTVGGELLSGLLAHVQEYGNVAAIGLAGGIKLETTVMPFILRGVSLIGVSTPNCPREQLMESWRRLGNDLRPSDPEAIISSEIGLDGLREASQELLERKVRGRTLVRVSD
ncbi:YhdH/YhfP family quinone oxidoreductase [Halorhodospira halochloris]|uniref:YhdH/YhfP family quinone oxidoreductase n=1 Tax=Halorhodospira halochloris TaxID=1052 RepID=UPI001EE94D65|nr:YhdH/YhfP family quinone oxidoreductase [Halorhodospira halochloris]MCG5547275.1 YhdH/YhfP family quinone oxidoreductase [Halorhodospira halochloris]